MTDRTEKIFASNARLLVSIHCNSVGFATDPEKIKGTAAFYRYVGFKPLANAVYARMLELGFDQFGVVGSFNFTLNAPTELPNVLVETAFLSNPEDEMKLIDDAFQKQLAEKIVLGLENFVKTAALSLPSPN
jgi:N-acetylmuramoyl-L-alanine amidase